MKSVFAIPSVLVLTAILCCCRNGGKDVALQSNDMQYASFIAMSGDEDGELVFRIDNPWKRGKTLRTYHIGNDIKTEFSVTDRDCYIHTPVRRAVVMTNCHARLLSELNMTQSVVGVCESEYITDPTVRECLSKGTIIDCGNSMRPDIEKIISLNPDVILVSPFEETGYGQLEKLGIPLVECADYMESSPLGRAEWIRFYGRIFGKGAESDSLFYAIRDSYQELKEQAAAYEDRPTVLLDTKSGSAWYMAGGASTIGRMIADAGGSYLFSERKESGSIPLSFESVYDKAGEADIWLMKNSGSSTMTYESLKNDFPPYSEFKPFKERRIWVCDVYQVPYFEMTSFHPEILLREFISIFHGKDFESSETVFYHPMSE